MFGKNPFGVFSFGEDDRSFTVSFSAAASLNVNFSYQIFTSTTEFITDSTDTPSNQPFYSNMNQPIDFKWTALGGNFIAGFSAGSGEMVVNNTSGEFDFLPQRYSISGRMIEIKYGKVNTHYSQWITAFRGTASDFFSDETTLTFDLVDNGFKLTVPLQTIVYGGTGGIDGTTDIAGKKKPRAFGYVFNVKPPEIYPNFHVFQVNNGPVNAITAVRDSGVALAFSADYLTSALLIAATIPGGQYATCLAEGMFRIVYQVTQLGSITADVQGDKLGGVFATTTAAIISRVLSTSTTLLASDLYQPSFNTLDLIQPAPVGYWSDENDTTAVVDVIYNLMSAIGGWGGFRRDGKLAVTRFDAPVAPPNVRIEKIDIIDIKRGHLPNGISPPPAKWQIGYQRNYTVQTQPAGATTDAMRSFIAQEYRYGTAEANSIRVDYPFSKDPAPVASYFRDLADAVTEATRRLNLFRVSRALYTIKIDVKKGIRQNVGETAFVTFDRWDLTVGRYLRILEISQSGSSDQIEMVAYG
jgi:hypothetical protein